MSTESVAAAKRRFATIAAVNRLSLDAELKRQMKNKTMPPLPKLTKQELLDAIRAGVRDAMWEMITNATSMPCHDFFDMVKAGVAEGVEKMNAQGGAQG